jgi:hypothetical protein
MCLLIAGYMVFNPEKEKAFHTQYQYLEQKEKDSQKYIRMLEARLADKKSTGVSRKLLEDELKRIREQFARLKLEHKSKRESIITRKNAFYIAWALLIIGIPAMTFFVLLAITWLMKEKDMVKIIKNINLFITRYCVQYYYLQLWQYSTR